MPKHIKEDSTFYDIMDWSLDSISAALVVKQAFFFYGLKLDIVYCLEIILIQNRKREVDFENISFDGIVYVFSKRLSIEKIEYLKRQLITKDFNLFVNLEFGLEDSPEKEAFKESISLVLQPDTLMLDLNCKFGRKAANCYAKSIKDEQPKDSIAIIKRIRKVKNNL